MTKVFRLLFSALWMLLFIGAAKLTSAQHQYSLEIVRIDSIITTKKGKKLFNGKKEFVTVEARKKAMQEKLIELHNHGYLAASFDSISSDSLSLKAFLRTGKIYKWAHLDKGNLDEGTLSKVGFREKIYFDQPIYFKGVSRLQNRIVNYYENNGYPFASVRLDSLEITDQNIRATLRLEKNGEFKVDSLVIKGNARVKRKYLYSYLGIRPGDLYNEKQMQKMKGSLKELAFVNMKRDPEAIFMPGKVDVYLFLENKKASQFDGILGILPDNSRDGKVLVTGNLQLRLLSALNRGELIDINWQKLQAATQSLNVNLVYPYLLSTPFGVDLKFDLYKKDSLYLNLDAGFGIQYIFSGNNYFKVFVERKSSSLLSTSGLTDALALNNLDFTNVLFGVGVRFSKLDYRVSPRKGVYLDATAAGGNKVIGRNPNLSETVYEGLDLSALQFNGKLLADYYIPIRNRSTIKTSAKMGVLMNKNLVENELFRIGGLKTLRGFDEESIFASSYAIFSAEYRFMLEQNSFLFAFFDGGYYQNISSGAAIYAQPIGFGAGISFETRVGIFSLSYALGKQFDNPITFRSGKIHFGVVSYF